jgi:hypothetical protein
MINVTIGYTIPGSCDGAEPTCSAQEASACDECGCSEGTDCSGTPNYEFKNDSWVPFTGTANYSNITKWVNATIGSEISWTVYANNSDGLWNQTDIFGYITTAPGSPPTPVSVSDQLVCSDYSTKLSKYSKTQTLSSSLYESPWQEVKSSILMSDSLLAFGSLTKILMRLASAYSYFAYSDQNTRQLLAEKTTLDSLSYEELEAKLYSSLVSAFDSTAYSDQSQKLLYAGRLTTSFLTYGETQTRLYSSLILASASVFYSDQHTQQAAFSKTALLALAYGEMHPYLSSFQTAGQSFVDFLEFLEKLFKEAGAGVQVSMSDSASFLEFNTRRLSTHSTNEDYMSWFDYTQKQKHAYISQSSSVSYSELTTQLSSFWLWIFNLLSFYETHPYLSSFQTVSQSFVDFLEFLEKLFTEAEAGTQASVSDSVSFLDFNTRKLSAHSTDEDYVSWFDYTQKQRRVDISQSDTAPYGELTTRLSSFWLWIFNSLDFHEIYPNMNPTTTETPGGSSDSQIVYASLGESCLTKTCLPGLECHSTTRYCVYPEAPGQPKINYTTAEEAKAPLRAADFVLPLLLTSATAVFLYSERSRVKLWLHWRTKPNGRKERKSYSKNGTKTHKDYYER